MATDILIKRSTTPGAVPTTGDLSTGELAINTADKRLFTNNSGTIVEIGTAPTSLAVTNNGTIGGTLGVTGTTTLSTVSTSGAATLASGSVTGNFSVTGTLTVSTPTNSTDAASKGYVDTAVANVIDSAPGALDTLNELAAAINDDANFATTVTNALAGKLALAGGTMTGDITLGANKITSTATPATDDTLTRKGYVDSILGSATDAATSAAAAAVSETNAANSASAASTSASNASTSATNAASSASAASTSASNASTSATAAASSATSASNSATASANSATAAATSATNAENAYDSFDDRYLGAKASDPSVDNDGDALLTGALYFNTGNNTMRVYNGSAWEDVVDAVINLADDTTPQLGGNLDLNSNDITGTGNINVTGTVTADGLTVDGNPTLNNTGDSLLNFTAFDGSQDATSQIMVTRQDVSTSKSRFRIYNNNGSGLVRALDITGDNDISFYEDTGTTPKLFWDASAERLGIGTSSPNRKFYVLGDDPVDIYDGQIGIKNTATSGLANTGSALTFEGHNGVGNRGFGQIAVLKENSTSNNNNTYMRFATRDNTLGSREVMRIDSSGNLLVGTTDTAPAVQNSDLGIAINGSQGRIFTCANGHHDFNRTADGELVRFRSAANTEGSISVSGSTVSYNGGHLSRWSRLADDSKDTSIVKGTVMTNLDAMVEWSHDAVDEVLDEEGNVVTEAKEAYTEDNEQLNKMAVSSIEGDPNVAGVFVNWDEDDDWNDMNIAMTGDMVIRIAQGTTVARGDLLMSAGDGTAKPQDDDIVRSKTIAKVTSTHVSHTYDDGSYLVPCVLMAC